MVKNAAKKKAIRALMEKHGLTYRQAARVNDELRQHNSEKDGNGSQREAR